VSAPVRKAPCHQLCHHAPQRTCETVAQVRRPFKRARQRATHGPATSGSDVAQTCITLRKHSAPRSRSASGAGPALGSLADSRVSRPAASPREHVGLPKARWASPALRRRSEPPRRVRQRSLAHAGHLGASLVGAESPGVDPRRCRTWRPTRQALTWGRAGPSLVHRRLSLRERSIYASPFHP
jgi:hypothetical protein